MEKLEKILVPTDFSPLSKRALLTALLLARKTGAEIKLLYVVPTYDRISAFNISVDSKEEMMERARKWAEKKMVDFLRGEDLSGITLTEEIDYGNEAQTIIERSDSMGCDLIVIASHGYSGLAKTVFGSVAEKVLKLSNTPVLVVKKDEKP
ncbi:MAG: universal stress protein [Deltaproteobacteria bacterium]|nr:MAG: universal stress protein [Deltaproteobacteria bacterium]